MIIVAILAVKSDKTDAGSLVRDGIRDMWCQSVLA